MKAVIHLTFLLFPFYLFSQNLTALQIADRAQDAVRVKGLEAVATMKIYDDKGNVRVRKIAQISKLSDNGNTEKRLIRFLEPADVKGTGLMTFDYKEGDDDIWLYMPALRKTRRIVSSDKAKNFMGSEFSYADMTPPTLDDFKFKLLDDEEVNGVFCYQIEWIPNDEEIADENGFSKRITFIGKSDFVIRKAVYYDIDDELQKELFIHEIKELDTQLHRFRAVHLEMKNLQNGRRSELINEKILFNPDIKDDYFTIRYLERE
ncbi:outer membrane lipoprotein-sorting protein [bacterium]|nr:outer membrane lipoprotein-sorting protein [bacterium]